MTFIAAMLLSGVLTALALTHFFWAIGGGGFGGAVPEEHGKPVFTPTPLLTALVGALLLMAAAIVAGRVGLWGGLGRPWIYRVGTLGLAAAFLLRGIGDFRYAGLFRRIRATRFAHWDAWLFTPLCLVLGLVLVFIAQS